MHAWLLAKQTTQSVNYILGKSKQILQLALLKYRHITYSKERTSNMKQESMCNCFVLNPISDKFIHFHELEIEYLIIPCKLILHLFIYFSLLKQHPVDIYIHFCGRQKKIKRCPQLTRKITEYSICRRIRNRN